VFGSTLALTRIVADELTDARGVSVLQKNRRGATRYNFGAIVEVVEVGSQRGLVSLTRDLSLSGCFVRTTSSLHAGTRVAVTVTSSGESFSALGHVTDNVSGDGMGIAFSHLEAKDQATLEKWLGCVTAK
jgi:hypothetical protein